MDLHLYSHNYREALNTPEWRNKRLEIIKRDNWRCQICNNRNIFKGMEIGTIEGRDPLGIKDAHSFYIKDYKRNIPYHKKLLERYNIDPYKNYIAYFYILPPLEPKLVGHFLTEKINYDPDSSLYVIHSGKERRMREILTPESYEYIYQNHNIEDIEWEYVDGLEVHHKYYESGRLPWEYPDDALITYCLICHYKIHKNINDEMYLKDYFHALYEKYDSYLFNE